MFKVILKTAFKTLLVVAILALVGFAIASLGFPSEMATLCEKSGNYSLATGYARLNYTYTNDVNDLNRCFVDSVYARNDGDIAEFGDKLIADEKFEEVCESNSKTIVTEQGTEIEINYKQYVYGNTACAKYRKGKKDEAFDRATAAMEGVAGFPVNNALAILSLHVIDSGDKVTADKLLQYIEENHQDTENEYYTVLINYLINVGGQE